MTPPTRRSAHFSRALGLALSMTLHAGVLWAQPAQTPPASTVSGKVLLLGSADDAAVLRMRDELRLLGLKVQVLDTDEEVEVARLADRMKAEAVAEVESWPPEIRLWVQGTEGDPSTLAIGDSLTDGEPELLALRAVELLRARLLPVPLGTEPPTPEPPTLEPPVAPPPSPPGPPRAIADVPSPVADTGSDEPEATMRPFGLFLGPAVAMQPAGPMPAFQIAAGVEYRLHPRLAVALRGLMPTHAATLETAEGEAMVRTLAVGAAARLTLTDPNASFGVLTAGGFGAAGVFFQGRGRDGGRGLDGSSWAASPFVALAARYVLTPVWALRFEIEGSMLLPRQVVRIAGEDAGDVGFPAVGMSAGVEVWP